MKNFWTQQYNNFLVTLDEAFKQEITQNIENAFYLKPHGKLNDWQNVIELKQGFEIKEVILNNEVSVKIQERFVENELKKEISAFKPWRKGPFKINDVLIDTEWRSDWKWDRIKNKIIPLTGKKVLDVGCGSGYHSFRMKGAGAQQVIGLEPMIAYVAQYIWLNKYLKQDDITVLPFTLEQWVKAQWVNDEFLFDTVFSMGVLYHRRSPIDHLYELKRCLNPGGQLVLETLIISGEDGSVLVPEGRYAKMRNVWFIPTVSHLKNWLQRAGFKNIEVIDINKTSIEEQRSTEWMEYESLIDFLDVEDLDKTIEGYPAPLRATLVATKK